MDNTNTSRRVAVLRDDVAKKIAAGEVIDRPLSVVRELLDNSIDAAAASIEVEIRGGGIEEIRVVDNGSGMTAEDIDLCTAPHATSKIRTIDDLMSTRTLGFRGEALSSIASSARLEVTSATADSTVGHRLVVHGGKRVAFETCSRQTGTTVSVKDLFFAVPARRRFLKRPSSEANRCRAVVLEHALAHPEIEFRYSQDGEIRHVLTATEDRTVRAASLFPDHLDPAILHDASVESEGIGVQAIVTDPSFHRGDRRYIYIFVNGRRIEEFALLQAVTYGYQAFLPGGRYPAAFVTISVAPETIDFNIHPTKREVRFRDMRAVHQTVVAAVKEAASRFAGSSYTPSKADYVPGDRNVGSAGAETSGASAGTLDLSEAREVPTTPSIRGGFRRIYESLTHSIVPEENIHKGTGNTTEYHAGTGRKNHQIIYHGQLFGLFLLAELDDELYIIDQHAAHERILYDAFASGSAESQRLVVPHEIDPDVSDSGFLEETAQKLARYGIEIEWSDDGVWAITALPSRYRGLEKIIVEFLESFNGTEENLERELFSTMSCRSAVKDGDPLDETTALQLAEQAFSLPEARCPHGRPLWHRITRAELFELVGRTASSGE